MSEQATDRAGLGPDELAVCELLGECARRYRRMLTDSGEVGPYDGLTATQKQDLGEFVAHVHDLQHAVMARAATRAHPEVFRP
jgi:hypothetical protein